MASTFDMPFMQLAAGEVYSGVSAIPREVQILSGCLWLTIEGDTQDYWLKAGDTMLLPSGCLIVVEAYRAPCLFSVRPDAVRIVGTPGTVVRGMDPAGYA